MAWEIERRGHDPPHGALSSRAHARTRRFQIAPREKSTYIRSRTALPAVAGLRFGGIEGRCGVGRDGAEIQSSRGPRNSARVWPAFASRAHDADSGGARWRKENVQEPRKLCGNH